MQLFFNESRDDPDNNNYDYHDDEDAYVHPCAENVADNLATRKQRANDNSD
jgi:hypothetical protein